MEKRLQQFLEAEDLSPATFAESIGVTRAAISHILTGRNRPGFDILEGMARRYPKLNIDWLVTGRGRMYRDREGTAPPLTTPAAPPRNVSRILVFYDDNTFVEMHP